MRYLILAIAIFILSATSCTPFDSKKEVEKELFHKTALISQSDSGLSQDVYDVIANHKKASVLEKNAVMQDVLNAISSYSNDENMLKSQITEAVNRNGAYPGWASAIKAAIDNTKKKIKTQIESGLKLKIYNAIAKDFSISIEQKNALMDDIRDVIAKKHKRLSARNKAIEDAVTKHARFSVALADRIKDAVNDEEPIKVMTEAESGLRKTVYDVIKDWATASTDQKNAIMEAVFLAINNFANDSVARQRAISDAVRDNGINFGNLATNISTAVDAEYAILKTAAAARLDVSIWQVIRDYAASPISVAVKNDIMEDVRKAIATAIDEPTRAAEIRSSLGLRGIFPGLDNAIIAAVDIANKIVPLKTQAQSGLDAKIWTIIYSYSNSIVSNQVKNDLMEDVRVAIDTFTDLRTRDDAISKAVTDRGFINLSNSLITAVNTVHRFEPLKDQPTSGLDLRVWQVIRDYSTTKVLNSVKNDIMEDVRKAIATAIDEPTRAAEIRSSLRLRGAFPGLDNAIIAAVDIAYKIVPLKTQTQSGLDARIWTFIYSYSKSIVSNQVKNDLMEDVRVAINTFTDLSTRDDAIRQAVTTRGFIGLSNPLIRAVNGVHRIRASQGSTYFGIRFASLASHP